MKKVNPNKSIAFKNDFLTSPYKKHPALSLSVPQTKLILFLVSQINKDDTEFKPVEINFIDFCEEFGISYGGGKNRELLQNHIRSLMSKVLEIHNGDDIDMYHWVQRAKINFKTQKIHLTLSDDVRPYYLELKENFTMYQLGYVSMFKNRYSFLLYDILKRWENYKGGKYYISIDNLREDLAPGKYPEMRDFNRYVLKPALAEINEKSDINVICNFVKEGKKIKTVCFLITKKSTAALNKIQSTWNDDFDLYSAEKKVFDDLQDQMTFEDLEFDEEIITAEIQMQEEEY